jgi:transcription antitermination factor NusG
MATSLLSPSAAESRAFFPEAYIKERWYAAYTCANHEKRVAEQLEERAVEHFLPLYGSVRRWKDRKVKLELPIFPGYVFVRLALRDRLRVLQTPGVARLVGFGGLPTALPDQEMEAMRNGLQRQLRLEPHPYLTIGRRVRLNSGPFIGLEGILVRRKGLLRLVLSLDLIQRSVAVEVDASDVEPIQSTRPGQGSLSHQDTVWV